MHFHFYCAHSMATRQCRETVSRTPAQSQEVKKTEKKQNGTGSETIIIIDESVVIVFSYA